MQLEIGYMTHLFWWFSAKIKQNVHVPYIGAIASCLYIVAFNDPMLISISIGDGDNWCVYWQTQLNSDPTATSSR